MALLPAPVRRYLEVMNAAGRPAPRVAYLIQSGELRAAANQPWMPFQSEQVYSFEPPGFVWLAKARLAPFVHMMARDRLDGGRGHMLVRLLEVVTVADARGTEIDQGAALRYWGEVLAFPEMVASPHLRWEAVDDRHARFVAEHEGLKISAVVEFGADGLPLATHADRYRDTGGSAVLTPWSGTFREWKLVNGRRFPTHWESVWHLPGGDFTAVRMEIEAMRTE